MYLLILVILYPNQNDRQAPYFCSSKSYINHPIDYTYCYGNKSEI